MGQTSLTITSVSSTAQEGAVLPVDAVSARIDKTSGVPIYLQIAQILRELIKSRSVVPGMLLPTEKAMCEALAVSKMTLRHAYGLLAWDGLIESKRGVGTFVSAPRLNKNLYEMRSFSEEMAIRGKIASSRLLHFNLSTPSFIAKIFFGLPEHQMVYNIQRLRLADNMPVAIETAELPTHLFPNLERFDLQANSLYRIIEEDYHIQLNKCTEEISSAVPDQTQQKVLGVDSRVGLLLISRKSYAGNATPVELSRTAYRGDLYVASIDAIRSRSE